MSLQSNEGVFLSGAKDLLLLPAASLQFLSHGH
jgi:hypothetical protein